MPPPFPLFSIPFFAFDARLTGCSYVRPVCSSVFRLDQSATGGGCSLFPTPFLTPGTGSLAVLQHLKSYFNKSLCYFRLFQILKRKGSVCSNSRMNCLGKMMSRSLRTHLGFNYGTLRGAKFCCVASRSQVFSVPGSSALVVVPLPSWSR